MKPSEPAHTAGATRTGQVKRICLTPVRNEAWILERFLACASLWADHIFIADQHSTDRTRAIASRFPKVAWLENPSSSFNEPQRQALLIDAARRAVAGPKLLLALDADEILSATFMQSAEWRRLVELEPGTVIRFLRANLTPDFGHYWIPNQTHAWGYVDDGAPHRGRPIHSPRLPLPPGAPSVIVEEVKVLHYQFTHPERMRSKHRWYQCWEALHRAHRNPIDVFRQYHDADGMHRCRWRRVPKRWFCAYERLGIQMRSPPAAEELWWDDEVLAMLDGVGVHQFANTSIWDLDWRDRARRRGLHDPERFADPRTPAQAALQRWLALTERSARLPPVAMIDSMLRLALWLERKRGLVSRRTIEGRRT